MKTTQDSAPKDSAPKDGAAYFYSDDLALGGWLGNRFIVIAPDAPPPVQYAAHQLQDYLRRMHGGKCLRILATNHEVEPHHLLPLEPCVYVGPSALLSRRHPEPAGLRLADEEFLVWKKGDALVLTGGSGRAALYAVYAFLEKYLGVRFVTSDLEHVPDRITPLPARIAWREKPAFESRDMVALWRASGDWAAKNRFNGHFSNLSALQGGRHAYYPLTHSWQYLVPADRYFARHPEYFSEISGERVPRQLCLSHPDVRAISKRALRRWVRENPEFSTFEISENDGGGWCECPACEKLNAGTPTRSRIVMDFVHDLAADLARVHPDKRVSTLSYATNRYPPPGLRVHPNVVIRLCTDPEIGPRLAAWREAGASVHVWAYYTNRFFPYLDGLRKAARAYRAAGATGFFVETRAVPNHGGIEPLPLQLYVAGRLLWNPSADPRPHVEDFMQHYYGPAAEEMLACLDHAYALKREMKLTRGPGYSGGWDGFYPMETYLPRLAGRCRDVLAAAARKTRGSEYGRRVEESRTPFLFQDAFGGRQPPRFGRDRAWPRDPRGRAAAANRLERISRHGGFRFPEQDALTPTPLTRLKRGSLELLILPAVGGRTVQLFHGRARTPLIPMPERLNDFKAVGFEEYAGRFYGGPGRADPFDVVTGGPPVDPGRVVLRCRLTDRGPGAEQQAHGGAPLPVGLEIRREIRLRPAGRVEWRTTLTNRARASHEGCVRAHPRLRFDPAKDEVEFTTRAGQAVRCRIAEFEASRNLGHAFVIDAGASATYLEGESLPAGRLDLRLQSMGVRAVFRFDPDATEKVLLIGSAGGTATLDFVSRVRRLAPRARMTYTYELQLKKESP